MLGRPYLEQLQFLCVFPLLQVVLILKRDEETDPSVICEGSVAVPF